MKSKFRRRFIAYLIVVACICTLSPLWSAEEASQPTSEETQGAPNEPQLTTPEIVVSKPIEAPAVSLKKDPVNLALRIDSNFSVGGASQQGFSIPSLRFSAFGNASEKIHYKLSLGQTREFSSILLPQIVPVEAYAEVSPLALSDSTSGWVLAAKVGMFTPSFNPWWTPDLTDLSYPGYFETHKSVFLSRDLGAEARFSSQELGLTVTGGLFNGNGIVASNTNNSKAVVGSVSYQTEVFFFNLTLGTSAYSLLQSTSGSTNYKSNWVSDFFIELAPVNSKSRFQLDYYTGKFEDSTRVVNPTGICYSAIFEFSDKISLFARGEDLTVSPRGTGQVLRHFQLGPQWMIEEGLKLFAYFDYQDLREAGTESTFQVLLRLVF